MLTSQRISVTLAELKTTWTLADLYDAHDALDLWDQLESKAAQAAENPNPKGSR